MAWKRGSVNLFPSYVMNVIVRNEKTFNQILLISVSLHPVTLVIHRISLNS
jgi:hypothetical protein